MSVRDREIGIPKRETPSRSGCLTFALLGQARLPWGEAQHRGEEDEVEHREGREDELEKHVWRAVEGRDLMSSYPVKEEDCGGDDNVDELEAVWMNAVQHSTA